MYIITRYCQVGGCEEPSHMNEIFCYRHHKDYSRKERKEVPREDNLADLVREIERYSVKLSNCRCYRGPYTYLSELLGTVEAEVFLGNRKLRIQEAMIEFYRGRREKGFDNLVSECENGMCINLKHWHYEWGADTYHESEDVFEMDSELDPTPTKEEESSILPPVEMIYPDRTTGVPKEIIRRIEVVLESTQNKKLRLGAIKGMPHQGLTLLEAWELRRVGASILTAEELEALAKKYGLSPQTVDKIRFGQGYKWLGTLEEELEQNFPGTL